MGRINIECVYIHVCVFLFACIYVNLYTCTYFLACLLQGSKSNDTPGEMSTLLTQILVPSITFP